jgi:hypothetical protein
MEGDQLVRKLWVAIEASFWPTKSLTLSFCMKNYPMRQGALYVNDHCQRMKTIADALSDVEHAVSPSQPVLNLLHGLNPRFSSTTDNIVDTTPLPDFNTMRQKLVLKELRLANEGKVSFETALHATGSSP